MNQETNVELKPIDYRNDINPVWCKGCGDYGVLKSFTRAFAQLKLKNEQISVISGIGCSSRIPGYCQTYGFNTVHGRALPIATGLKVARPDLTVLACGGDGDAFAIGGGHIAHAVRRNPDITYFVMDNNIYGLTKGQASPTTSMNFKQKHGLPGIEEWPLNPALILMTAGAGFIARTQAGDMKHMADILSQAIRYPGFAFVHCLSVCVTYQGKEFQDKVHQKIHPLPENYDKSDERAAFEVARLDPWAMGVIYERPLSEEFSPKRVPVDE